MTSGPEVLSHGGVRAPWRPHVSPRHRESGPTGDAAAGSPVRCLVLQQIALVQECENATASSALWTTLKPALLKVVKNFSFLGCIRGPGGRSSRAGGAAVRGAPPLREEAVRPHRAVKERRIHTPFHFQYIAHQGACRKTRVVPHNRWSRPEPTEMGVANCVCCCRRVTRAGASNRWWDSRCGCGHSARRCGCARRRTARSSGRP